MRNRFLNYTLGLAVLTLLGFKASAQNIQAEAKLQQYTIKIGDQTKLFFSIHQPAGVNVSFPKLADTVAGKVQVVNINKPDTSYDSGDRKNMTVIQSYTITSFDPGTYTIPSFAIGAGKDTVKTNELTLQVQTVKVDTTKGIYDIKQPLAVSYTWLDWLHDNWYWVAGPLALIALIAGLILYFKKRPAPEPEVKVVKPSVPPHTIALSQLKELREKKLWQQEQVKQYYIELSDILREYLEKRYSVKTHEKTTDEIFDELRYSPIAQESKHKLRQLLMLADLVKFAKEKPVPAENEESMDKAIEFVTDTQSQQIAEDKREGGNENA